MQDMRNLIENEVKLHEEMFLSFPKSRDKLDQTYFHSWIETGIYPELSAVEHINLTSSHGQAYIERVYCEQGHIRCFALFGSIGTIKKYEKHPWMSNTLSKVRGWSLQFH